MAGSLSAVLAPAEAERTEIGDLPSLDDSIICEVTQNDQDCTAAAIWRLFFTRPCSCPQTGSRVLTCDPHKKALLDPRARYQCSACNAPITFTRAELL